jgi:hypothetical protein
MLPQSRSTYRYRQEKAAAAPVGALSRWPEVLHTGPVLRCPACRCRHLHVDYNREPHRSLLYFPKFRNSFTFGFYNF